MYQAVPLSLIGATSENRSHQASNQLTKNWYPESLQKGGGVAGAIFLPWFGSQAFGTSTGNLDRGVHKWNNTMFHVVNTTLYSVDNTGVYTSIGTIAGTDRCIFENSIVGSADLMVIAGGVGSYVYTWDGTTLTQSSLQDRRAVTYLNSKCIYDKTGQDFDVSGAGGATTIASSGSAESSPDNLLRPYAFKQWVYMFGTESLEPFYDNGASSGVPLSRIDNAIMPKGLGGFYTVAHTDRALYFLADDSNVYQVIQSQLTKISEPDMVSSIKDKNYDTATGYTLTLDGKDYYVLRFTSGLTWVYDEKLGEWFNISTGTDDGPYFAQSYLYIYDKHIGVDQTTANPKEMSLSLYTDSGDEIQRTRVTVPFTSQSMGMPLGKRLKMKGIVFTMQTGTGIVSGQGSDPKIMVSYSLDGGETWSTERWVPFGKMGKYLLKVKYDEIVSFQEISFKIEISDPVFCSLHGATIYVKDGGY